MKSANTALRLIAALLAVVVLAAGLSACDGKKDDSSTHFETGTSQIVLIAPTPEMFEDKGEPIVRVGTVDMSRAAIFDFMKMGYILSFKSYSVKTAAYELAAIRLAEAELKGTALEVSDEYKQGLVDKMDSEFESEREENELYCEAFKISTLELKEFSVKSMLNSYIKSRHMEHILETLKTAYKDRYGEELVKEDYESFYAEYMNRSVKELDYIELDSAAAGELQESAETWRGARRSLAGVFN